MLYKPTNDESNLPDDHRSRANWITLAFAVPVLAVSCIGFGMKFNELIHAYKVDPHGVFAVTPIVNYLLASLGFLCLLLWAAINGTFHDLEAPKRTMLQRELELDKQTNEMRTDYVK